MVTDRYCDNLTCAMNGTYVSTDRTECLGCGGELAYATANLFGGVMKPSDIEKLLRDVK